MKTTMTNELPAEIMENGIHYTLVGDYYFPTCMLADRSPNGKWASLYERYLQENYTDPSLCLSKVGDRFNISDTYLSHMFKEKTGQNFSVYLERLRMNEAARRLTSGDCNLTVLYADLGYTNPTSFRRAFKKYYGMTPSEMRDQPRRQEEKSE